MRKIWHRLGLLATLLGLATTLATLPGAPAQAATSPVLAGLTITPTVTVVGHTVTVVGTATNTTASAVQASLGIDNYGSLRITSVAGSSGCTPRNLTKLVYCGVQSLAPGATATITLTLTPAAAGAFDFRTYARITYSSDNSFATGTLTVS